MAAGWMDKIREFAPTIGRALGLAGVPGASALAAVSEALLGHPNGTTAEVAERVANWAPADELAMKAAEQKFALDMSSLLVSLEKVDADDRSSARAREIAVKDHMPALLAIMLSLMVMGCVALLSFHVVPPENREPFLLLTGSISTCWIGATTYYHGTSSGSKSKDAVIGKMAATR